MFYSSQVLGFHGRNFNKAGFCGHHLKFIVGDEKKLNLPRECFSDGVEGVLSSGNPFRTRSTRTDAPAVVPNVQPRNIECKDIVSY